MSNQKAFLYVPPFSHRKYDVFLSFRGEDTRMNFADHLYAALNEKGINVFRDDNKLERGKSIRLELFKAIEESRFSVIVFSKNYAYSTWCLDELVKIVEYKKTNDQKMVFPIFYDIEATVVRKQTGDFQKAFAKHEDVFRENIEKVQKWRDALNEVVDISGWELKDRGANDVRMIGIYGMGGLGKTTIARVIYDLISCEYEGSSFLSNVREICKNNSVITLQKQFLSELLNLANNNIWNVHYGINIIESRLQRKKVLLVIDDMVNIEQLESLAKDHDWFGLGSRIIITSRDKHLLMTHGVDKVYKLKGLNHEEALQLFCMKAFKAHQPMKEYEQLSAHVLKYAAGLPLALKVLGSFLFGRTLKEWKSTLQRLKRDSTNRIMQILQISFDGLQETEKKIFLDIICFFKGKDRDYVTKILDGCNLDPIIGIPILIEKSLISILNHNIVWMHDLLQEMGQQIIKRECKQPEKRSRLWEEEDVHHVLSKNKGTEVIEGIILNYLEDETSSRADTKALSKMTNLIVDAKSFLEMTNLRILKIHNVQLPKGLEYLSNELRSLESSGYPLESLPSNWLLDKTIELSMCYSNVKQMLSTSRPLNNLKFMRFKHSKNLIKTPDFIRLPNLEELNLEGCTRLCEIHPSLLLHSKVIFLSLKDCTGLITLPSKIHMGSLRQLILSGCLNLRKFPEIVGSMEYLSELLLDGITIKELPESVEHLSGLISLNLKDCKSLESFPSVIIDALKDLKTLNFSGCSKLEKLPENLGKVECLEELDISETAIRQPPSSIFLLKNLKSLSFRGCKGAPASKPWFSHFPINLMPRRSSNSMSLMLPSLSGLSSLKRLDLSDCNLGEGAILNDIWNLFSLEELSLSRNNFVSLPGTINRLSKLESLELEDCKRLQSLPELPSSTWRVRVDGCASLERVSNLFEPHNSNWLLINSVNCLKLVGSNDLAFSMLKDCLRQSGSQLNSRDGHYWKQNSKFNIIQYAKLSIVIPGSKIPEWFRFQNKGSSITVTRPPNSYNNNKRKFVGYAISCIFHVHKHTPTVKLHPLPRTYRLVFRIKVDKSHCCGYFIHFDEQMGQPFPDHLWLCYLSNQALQSFPNWNNEFNHVELSFICKRGPGLEVKRCGVHPLYVDEGEEFNKTTMEWRTSEVWNINESDDQVFTGSMMDVATTSKRSLPYYAGADQASAMDEEPPTKRNKELE